MTIAEQVALATANRILHGDEYDEDDVQLIAGALIQALARVSTGTDGTP